MFCLFLDGSIWAFGAELKQLPEVILIVSSISVVRYSMCISNKIGMVIVMIDTVLQNLEASVSPLRFYRYPLIFPHLSSFSIVTTTNDSSKIRTDIIHTTYNGHH